MFRYGARLFVKIVVPLSLVIEYYLLENFSAKYNSENGRFLSFCEKSNIFASDKNSGYGRKE